MSNGVSYVHCPKANSPIAYCLGLLFLLVTDVGSSGVEAPCPHVVLFTLKAWDHSRCRAIVKENPSVNARGVPGCHCYLI